MMPKVPSDNVVPMVVPGQVAPQQPTMTQMMMAASMMHQEGRLFDSSNDSLQRDMKQSIEGKRDADDDPDGMHQQADILSAAETQRRNTYQMLQDRRKGK